MKKGNSKNKQYQWIQLWEVRDKEATQRLKEELPNRSSRRMMS